MIYPLSAWDNLKDGYHFLQPTHYGAKHLGHDKFAEEWTRVYAPTDGKILIKYWGNEGGNTLQFLDNQGKLWRFLHLIAHSEIRGKVREGELICYVGNTGKYGGSPHLHVDISINGKLDIHNINNFIDPQIYIKDNLMKFPPDRVVWNLKDGEYYWTKKEGYLSIAHDRLLFASLQKRGDGITIDEDISNQVIGTF